MDDLIAFLRTRLDEDEAVAKAADMPGVHPRGPWQRYDNGRIEDARGYTVAKARPESSEHIARWDPARVLAEVDAKRRILDWCERMAHVDGYGGLMARDARMIRRLLAQPYAEHPDYRPEWRS